jgi:hypothetical protein
MRIGEVNSDNYKYFLQLFGIKDSKALDALLGKDKDKVEEEDYDAFMERVAIEKGGLEGMLVKGDDMSWHRIVPVSEEVKDELINAIRQSFLTRGMSGGDISAPGGGEIAAINRKYLEKTPVAERLPVSWTLAQVHINEERRIMAYIKTIDPNWQWGQKPSKHLAKELQDSKFGTITKDGVDVKA